MKKLKGPELKMPELKVPTFLVDLYYDLRDRRLLPLIALVLVAIVAVPILMGSSPKELPPLPAGGATVLGSTPGKTSKLTVVEATPGLRDYRKRLRGRQPTDPFEQLYTEPASNSASSSGEGSSTSSSSSASSGGSVTTESSSTTVEVETGGSPNGGGSNGSGGRGPGGGQSQGPRLVEFVFDVQISHAEETADGGQKMSEPEVRHRVRTLTQLPGKKTPVVTVAGVNLHNGKVWFLVSDGVKSLDGDFGCVTRTPAGICELLEIEAGFPLELVYGPNNVLYRIKVTKIDAIWAGRAGDSRSSRAAFNGPANAALPAP